MKLIGFLVLLVVVFVAAYAAGARFGPITTGNSQVQYSGGTGSGMDMGGGSP